MRKSRAGIPARLMITLLSHSKISDWPVRSNRIHNLGPVFFLMFLAPALNTAAVVASVEELIGLGRPEVWSGDESDRLDGRSFRKREAMGFFPDRFPIFWVGTVPYCFGLLGFPFFFSHFLFVWLCFDHFDSALYRSRAGYIFINMLPKVTQILTLDFGPSDLLCHEY